MRTYSRNLGLLGVVALATGWTACSSIVTTEKPDKPPVTTSAELMRRAASCEDLELALKNEVRARLALMMQNQGGVDEDNGWGAAGSSGDWSADAGAPSTGGSGGAMSGSGGSSTGAAGSSSGDTPPGAFTGTNTQVTGVDEADFVKTDGQRIYQLRERMLHVAKAWPVTELSLQSSVQVEGAPLEMFLVGEAGSPDQKLVIYSIVDGTGIYAEAGLEPPQHDAIPAPTDPWGAGGSPAWEDGGTAMGAVSLTKITIVSVAGPSPTVLHEVYFDGSYVSSRRLDAHVRTVLHVPGNLPELRTWATAADRQKAEMLVITRLLAEGKDIADIPSEELDQMVRAALGEVLAQENDAAIEGMTVADWLPHVFTRSGGSLVTSSVACEDFYIPKAGTSQLGITHVAPVDVQNPTAPATGTAIVGVADTMYQNASAMVLASTAFDGDYETPTWSTYVHAFDLQGLPLPAYKASGVVQGRILGQFALDEKDGFVRVVTTSGEQWSAQGTANHLFVLASEAGTLQVVGDAGNFAQDEQVYAVRYVGDTAYVVTFRQTDPLFAIDLSNPRAPTILGELHIPGFSEYMHPLGDTHLLTVGRDADPNTGWSQNLALQIFDVTDRTAPKLAHKHVFQSYGSSAAEYDHKAFAYFADRQLLAIPFISEHYDEMMGYYSLRSSMELFRVGAQDGISEIGAMSGEALLSQAERDPEHYYCDPYYYYGGVGSAFERGIFVDEVLFGVARDGIVAANVAQPSQTLAVLPLKDPNVVPTNCWETGGYGGTGGSTGGTGGAWDGGPAGGGGDEWDAGAAGGSAGAGPAFDAGTGGTGGA